MDGPKITVGRDDYADTWPFTFDGGTLVCSEVRGQPCARIIASDGVEYALNGPAISQGYVELDDTSDVWLEDDDWPRKSLHLARLKDMALRLCER